MKHLLYITCVTLFSLVIISGQDNPIYGPQNGSLLAIGGGNTPFELIELFRDQMGGWDAPLVVVPTAQSGTISNTSSIRQQWINIGFTNVTVLHTRDTMVANTDAFIEPLLDAKGVWFTGGRQWRLVDAYQDTKTLDAFWDVLDRGGIIAGSSAGASIQASFLARGWELGNTEIISPDPKHQVGFGFLKNAAIDQHIDARDRWDDMAEIIDFNPDILGIGLSESTAIFVQGDCIEVLGTAQVAITDSSTVNDCSLSCYELLYNNDLFNMQNRQEGACDFTSTSIPENTFAVEALITIYPNPSSGDFGINAKAFTIEGIQIYNLQGKRMQTINTGPVSHVWVRAHTFPSGMYIVQVSTDQGVRCEKVYVD